MEDAGRIEAIQLGRHRVYRWPISAGWRLLCWPFKIDIERSCIDAYRLSYYDWDSISKELGRHAFSADTMRSIIVDAQANNSHELPSNVMLQHYLIYTGEEIALDEAMKLVQRFIDSAMPNPLIASQRAD